MSNTFTDTEGRGWSLRITLGDLPALKAEGFNPSLALKDLSAFDTINSPETFGRGLWVLVEPQAAKAGVSPEQFAQAVDGPTLAAAGDALLGALADFSQRPAVAAAMKNRLPDATAKAEAELIRLLTA